MEQPSEGGIAAGTRACARRCGSSSASPAAATSRQWRSRSSPPPAPPGSAPPCCGWRRRWRRPPPAAGEAGEPAEPLSRTLLPPERPTAGLIEALHDLGGYLAVHALAHYLTAAGRAEPFQTALPATAPRLLLGRKGERVVAIAGEELPAAGAVKVAKALGM